MNTYRLIELWNECVAAFAGGRTDFEAFLSQEQKAYLYSIGATPTDFQYYVGDNYKYQEPYLGTVLTIYSQRYTYLKEVMQGEFKRDYRSVDSLPAKTDEYQGIPWLPRIADKVMAKFRGDLPVEVMYGCSGDRKFLRKYNTNEGEFMGMVWATEGDLAKLAEFLKAKASALTGA